MINSLTVTNYLNESITITLTDGEPDHGLIILGIEGIGAPKADINTTSMAASDGSVYNSARADQRNIVMSLLLEFSPKIEDARHRTYKYFPIKKPVTLLFHTDNRDVKIVGRVESNEPVIFSEKETVQISFICPDPYFYSELTNTTVFAGIDPLFEFIYENESVDEPMTEFGSIENQTERNIYYDGEADVGIVITIHAIGPAKMIEIYNTGTREHMKIDTNKIRQLTGAEIDIGDDIIIDTRLGKKSIKLLRAGHYTNILNCLDRDCDWFRITKGDNIFAYVCDEGSENLYFMIENEIVYEGV